MRAAATTSHSAGAEAVAASAASFARAALPAPSALPTLQRLKGVSFGPAWVAGRAGSSVKAGELGLVSPRHYQACPNCLGVAHAWLAGFEWCGLEGSVPHAAACHRTWC